MTQTELLVTCSLHYEGGNVTSSRGEYDYDVSEWIVLKDSLHNVAV